MMKKKIVNIFIKFITVYIFSFIFILEEKQSDEGEQYDDSVMDTSSLPIEKSSTTRYINPAKSG